MSFQEVLNYCLYTVLTAILPVIAAYIVNLIKAKIKESEFISETAKNEAASLLIKEDVEQRQYLFAAYIAY